MITDVVDPTTRPAVPWSNGGGLTRVLLRRGDGERVDWRLSLADLAPPAVFSAYPGIDRILLLVAGPALRLDVDGEQRMAVRGRPVLFDGEAAVTARAGRERAATSRVLNLMTRRGAWRGALEVRPWRLLTDDMHTVVLIAGEVRVGARSIPRLGVFDPAAPGVRGEPDALVACLRIDVEEGGR